MLLTPLFQNSTAATAVENTLPIVSRAPRRQVAGPQRCISSTNSVAVTCLFDHFTRFF
jgi:hypothetical protein